MKNRTPAEILYRRMYSLMRNDLVLEINPKGQLAIRMLNAATVSYNNQNTEMNGWVSRGREYTFTVLRNSQFWTR